MSNSISKDRALDAWKFASEAMARKDADKYLPLVKGASAFIMSNGLMQALAFYQSRKREEATLLNKHLIDWLSKTVLPSGSDSGSVTFQTMMNRLLKADSITYMRATEEALELLRWMRQFADALKNTAPTAAAK